MKKMNNNELRNVNAGGLAGIPDNLFPVLQALYKATVFQTVTGIGVSLFKGSNACTISSSLLKIGGVTAVGSEVLPIAIVNGQSIDLFDGLFTKSWSIWNKNVYVPTP